MTDSRSITPQRIVASILSAVGLISLVEDLQLVRLRSRIGSWVDVWQSFVETVGSFLFDWIRLGWLGVSTTEQHGLMLILVVYGAASRASWQHREHQRNAQISSLVLLTCLMLLPVTIILILLPAVASLPLSTIYVTLYIALHSADGERPHMTVKGFAGQLGATLSILLIVVLADFVLFEQGLL